MATASTVSENDIPPSSGAPASGMLVSLSTLSPEAMEMVFNNLAQAFPNQDVVVVTPDAVSSGPSLPSRVWIKSYTPEAPPAGGWLLSAADYLNAYKLMQDNSSTVCLLLGPEAQSLSVEALRNLAGTVAGGKVDLAMPRYSLSPRDGLVNSAILYPTTRALYGTKPRYPLAVDLAFSARLANRLAAVGQRFTATGQNSAVVWPVSEAATAGFSVIEVAAGTRALPGPDSTDLNAVLAQVTGSFFSDIDAKASFWQRARLAYSPKAAADYAQAAQAHSAAAEAAALPDIQPMLESFRIAYTNLHEIWSLVLTPNSLLGLKKLSMMPPASFRMPDSLWARIVYDFVLAYHLRTLNRGHLLGALTPLYLAWVASHLLLTGGAGPETLGPEQHIETLAAAFEADKPYLVSRWRWPDRFNP